MVVGLEAEIEPSASLLVDSSAVLAYLAGGEPTSQLAGQLFDAFVATGRNPATISMVTVHEILVRPFRSGLATVAIAEGFLRHFAEIRLAEVTYDIARESARIRASTGIRAPDALIVATALAAGVDVLVTNDRSLGAATQSMAPHVKVCLLLDQIQA